MSEELLAEIKEMNRKLDLLIELEKKPKGLSPGAKIGALVLGFIVIGPVIISVVSALWR